ncbi:MAG: ABC transporter permease [Bacteroidota bacterium]
MIKQNLIVALRSFARHRSTFFVNLTGLTAGLLTTLFIYTWVHHELSVDQFHEEGDRIFRLVNDTGGQATLLNSSPRFADELRDNIPEIELLVHSSWGPMQSNLVVEDEVFSVMGEFGSAGYFDLFSYPLLMGEASSCLLAPNAIMLSERLALRLFQRTDVVGEQLEWRWYSMEEPVVVSGVYKDLPSTSSAQFDYVLSFQVFEKRFKERIERGNRNGRAFLRLTPGADPDLVNEKIATYTQEQYPQSTMAPSFLIPYGDYYLRNQYEQGEAVGGRIVLVRLFVAIGVLILFIACVNFVNLSTAQAVLRGKEIGVRKVLGADRLALVVQFWSESLLLCSIAGGLAMVLLILLFPFFEKVIGQAIGLSYSMRLVLAFLLIIGLTGLLSGSYPSFHLTGFKPLRVMKGLFQSSASNQWFRQGLVAFQFTASLVLLVGVVVVYHQMKLVQTKDLGYSQEMILNFDTQGMNGTKQESFLSAVKRLPGVVRASGISHALFGAQKSGANITWVGKDPESEVWFEWGFVRYDMLELLDVGLASGRFFTKGFGADETKVVINQATQEVMGLDDVLGERLTVGETDYEIIGVLEDFHYQSLHQEIQPTFFLLNDSWSMRLAIKLDLGQSEETIEAIERLYGIFNPGFSFDYTFHDQDRLTQYVTEQRVTVLAKYAAALAILISCLGLYGLTRFLTERKSKELGIRKVLGADARALTIILSKDFIKPLTIAALVGLVASIGIAESWLNDFAYRVSLQWWYFVVALLPMGLLVILTAGMQIARALAANPIDAIRDE